MQATMIGGTGFAAGQAAARRSAPAPAPAPADLVTQLKELAELRDKGSLSPDEFDAAKQKLLAD